MRDQGGWPLFSPRRLAFDSHLNSLPDSMNDGDLSDHEWGSIEVLSTCPKVTTTWR
jgi:hypothetical protein